MLIDKIAPILELLGTDEQMCIASYSLERSKTPSNSYINHKIAVKIHPLYGKLPGHSK